MSIKKRLKEFVKYKQISKKEFYRNIKVSDGYLDRDSTISSDVLIEIMQSYSNINYKWLILGEGNMLNT